MYYMYVSVTMMTMDDNDNNSILIDLSERNIVIHSEKYTVYNK